MDRVAKFIDIAEYVWVEVFEGDHRMSEEVRRQIRAHLSICPDCKETYNLIKNYLEENKQQLSDYESFVEVVSDFLIKVVKSSKKKSDEELH